ncbi:MAG: SPOR domain-containing protein [Bacteroidales bacterium]|jgi:hypothetical protein|nr:SPOR domain-containing protein [Bacteroidales bacterium]
MVLRKIVLFFAVYFLAGIQFSKAQTIHIVTDIDTVRQTLLTKVYFCHIQAKDKVRWQQVVLPTSKVMIADNQGTIWDTVDNLLTVIWNRFPRQDTLVYSFTVQFIDEMPASFYWGKGALLFVNTNNVIEKITTYPQCIRKAVTDSIVDISNLDTVYYIQVGVGGNHREGDYRLQDGDRIFTVKHNNVYKYQVGPYVSMEQARKCLQFYRKKVPDAFIVKEVKN